MKITNQAHLEVLQERIKISRWVDGMLFLNLSSFNDMIDTALVKCKLDEKFI